MSPDPDSLVLEHLRAIRSVMARLADGTGTMRSEMTALRHQVAAVVTLQEHDHTDIAAIRVPLDRTERRLDLVE
jgi:hypothetical protein